MRRARVAVQWWFLSLAWLGLVTTGPVEAGDWPRWRGPTGDGHLGFDEPPLKTLPDDANITLKIPTYGGFASPVVANNRVYLFDNREGNETLNAIDLTTRQIIWSHIVDQVFKDGQGAPGPRNTPQIDSDLAFAVSCRGELQCLNTETGALIWQRNYTGDFGAKFIGEKGSIQGAARHGNNGSPLVQGNRLYAFPGGTSGSSVVCLDKRTGELIWRSQNDLAGYAPPVIAKVGGTTQLFCYTVEGLMSLDPANGNLFWRFPVSTPFGRHVTTPVTYQNLVVVSSVEEGLIATRTDQDQDQDQDSITFERAWTNKPSAINFSSPIRIGGYLYGLGPQKDFICIDVATGEGQWSQTGYIFSPADKAHASFIAMNDKILALTDTGEVVLYEANPNEFVEHGRLQVSGKTWSNPAYANGVLYLKDGLNKAGHLYGIRLAPSR